MFKLIALEVTRPANEEIVDTERYSSIHKILSFKKEDYGNAENGRMYYFHQGYKCENGRTVIDDESARTPNTFYTSTGTKISFSAIVGENGMGKSSLLGLFIRLMNNTAYVLRDGIDKTMSYNLIFVPDVYVRAYFETDEGEFFSLEQFDDNIIYIDQKLNKLWRVDIQRISGR